MKILIIEDEKGLLETISEYLTGEGFKCETAPTYYKAEDKISLFNYDIIILDITLPDGNGMDLIPLIKKMNPKSGLLILSARNSISDKVKGLDYGADDYLTKPFHLAELNSRIKSFARRRFFDGKSELKYNEIKIDLDSSEVFINEDKVELTRKEYEILLFFMTNRNKVITKESIAEHIWGDYIFESDNFDFIYSHIKNLRKKIEMKNGSNYLHNIYGIGYKFSEK
jgi:DNA-binding response OmpR family regulator